MKKIVLGILAPAMLVLSACAGAMSSEKTSIAYVNRNMVIQNFTVAQKVREQIQANSQAVQKDIEARHAATLAKINGYKDKLDSAEKAKSTERVKELSELIELTATNYNETKKSIETKLNTENETISKEVLDQINAYIEDYGRKMKYTMIFDVTSGVLYKDTIVDITQTITDGLNGKK